MPTEPISETPLESRGVGLPGVTPEPPTTAGLISKLKRFRQRQEAERPILPTQGQFLAKLKAFSEKQSQAQDPFAFEPPLSDESLASAAESVPRILTSESLLPPTPAASTGVATQPPLRSDPPQFVSTTPQAGTIGAAQGEITPLPTTSIPQQIGIGVEKFIERENRAVDEIFGVEPDPNKEITGEPLTDLEKKFESFPDAVKVASVAGRTASRYITGIVGFLASLPKFADPVAELERRAGGEATDQDKEVLGSIKELFGQEVSGLREGLGGTLLPSIAFRVQQLFTDKTKKQIVENILASAEGGSDEGILTGLQGIITGKPVTEESLSEALRVGITEAPESPVFAGQILKGGVKAGAKLVEKATTPAFNAVARRAGKGEAPQDVVREPIKGDKDGITRTPSETGKTERPQDQIGQEGAVSKTPKEQKATTESVAEAPVEPKPSGGVKQPFEIESPPNKIPKAGEPVNPSHLETLKQFRERDKVGIIATRQALGLKPEKFGRSFLRRTEREHRNVVEAALDKGETVPAEVLADFPDLKPSVKIDKTAAGVADIPAADISFHEIKLTNKDNISFFHGDNSIASSKNPLNSGGQFVWKKDGFWFLKNEKSSVGHRISDPRTATKIQKWYDQFVKPKVEVAGKTKLKKFEPVFSDLESHVLRTGGTIRRSTKEAISEIIDGKRESNLGNKEFKQKMLAELDKAIEAAAETFQQHLNLDLGVDKLSLKIHIPGDGLFTIRNTKDALREVRSRVVKIPNVEKVKLPSPKIAKPQSPEARAAFGLQEVGSFGKIVDSKLGVPAKTLKQGLADGTVVFEGKSVEDLRANIRRENKSGAKLQLRKNPRFGKRSATGKINDDPFILTGKDTRGRSVRMAGKEQFLSDQLNKFSEGTKGESITLGFLGTNPDVLKSIGTDAVSAMRTISSETNNLIKDIKGPAEVNKGVEAAKKVMIDHDRQIRRSESTSKLLEKTVKDIVPDQKDVPLSTNRQMLMLQAYETKMRGKFWDQLTEIEKGVVRFMGHEKAKLNRFIEKNGLLELMKSKDVNHIFHHWINPKTGNPYEAMFGKFSKGLPQAKQRTIPTYEAGIKAGLKPATTNLGKLIGLEWEAATRAHNSRQMFRTLHNISAKDGIQIELRANKPSRQIRMVERWDLLKKQGLTDGYERYSHFALDKPIVFKDADGKLTILRGPVGVRKELFPFVKSYVESPTYGKLDQINFATKSLKLGVSFFHVTSLAFQELVNFRVPFKNIPRGLRLRRDLDPTVRLLHQEGLELFKGYEDLGFRNKFFEGEDVWSKAGNGITIPIQLMRTVIFDIVQPGMKSSFVFDTFNKKLPDYLKGHDITLAEARLQIESGNITHPRILQAARESVQAGDGHFSGESYKRSLLETNRFMAKWYFGPETRKWWQRLLLSPTWQREHLIVAKNVAKSFLPDKAIKKLGLAELGPIKSEYRKYALGAVALIGAVDLMNYMMTEKMDGKGKHIWENPEGKGFAIRAPWNEPSYTNTDVNGKERTIEGGAAYVRPLKSVYEVAEFVVKPVQKFSYKLSPMMAAVGSQLFEDNFGRKYKGLPDLPKRFRDFALDVATPITASQAARLYEGKITPQSAVLPFFGFPTSKDKFKSRIGETNRIKELLADSKDDEAREFRKLWIRHHPNQEPIRSVELLKLEIRQKSERSKIEDEAEKIVAEIKTLSLDSQKTFLRNLGRKDFKLMRKVRGIIENDRLGLTSEEKGIKSLGVENGSRSEFIFTQAVKMKETERRAYFIELRKKKILTNKVEIQVRRMLREKPMKEKTNGQHN